MGMDPMVDRARRQALAARSRILLDLSDRTEAEGPRGGLAYLLGLMAAGDPNVRGLRLWQIDAAMFGVNRRQSLRTIRKARDLCGDRTERAGGFLTLGWALEGRAESVRMTSWLWELMKRERGAAQLTVRPPKGLPFDQLYDPGWADE